jgi:Flp pilus assembly secretin CpaC
LAAAPDTVRIVDTLEVESASMVEMRARVAELQLAALEKDAQLTDMASQLDAARQEVVRTMAKLQSQATRAEAASGMAEAEIAVRDLRSAGSGQGMAEIGEAERLLASSLNEFNDENYSGALYLATQARTMAETSVNRMRGQTGQMLRPGETPFPVPVRLETLRRANVREGPGLEFTVLHTLEVGTALAGHSHTDEWVRVTDNQGREGWIFLTLVTAR